MVVHEFLFGTEMIGRLLDSMYRFFALIWAETMVSHESSLTKGEILHSFISFWLVCKHSYREVSLLILGQLLIDMTDHICSYRELLSLYYHNFCNGPQKISLFSSLFYFMEVVYPVPAWKG